MHSLPSRFARRLLGSGAVLMAAVFGAGTAGAQATNTQTIGQSADPGTEWIVVASGDYAAGGALSSTKKSSVHIDGNSQSARYVGNAGTTTVTVAGAPFGERASSAVTNTQTADATMTATTGMTIAAPGRISETSVMISSNTNDAVARMSDAANAISTETADAGVDTVLQSKQSAKGSLVAAAATGIESGSGSAAPQDAQLTVRNNETSADATANRTTNNVAATARGATAGQASFDNRQYSEASSLATARQDMTLAGGDVARSDLVADGNDVAAVARGNFAQNSISTDGGSRTATGSATELANNQVNAGRVETRADITVSGPLNSGTTTDSRLAMTGNSALAAAYGNVATNTVTGDSAVTVGNVQTSSGPISAHVVGRFPALVQDGASSSAVAMTGNSLAASAIGNAATNVITVAR